MTLISIIVALDKNRLIGHDNRLPWRLPADMRRFVSITSNKPVIMGRKTFESIGRPLKNRTNIILTRDALFRPEGCIVVNSVERAIKACAGAEEAVVIGGASVYEQFLPFSGKIYMTLIDHQFEGDKFFPQLDMSEWLEIEREAHKKDPENPYDYVFLTLKRKTNNRLV